MITFICNVSGACCLSVCLFDCGCLILFTVRGDAHYKILTRLTLHKVIQKHLWNFFFFLTAPIKKNWSSNDNNNNNNIWSQRQAMIFFFSFRLFNAVVILHHALDSCSLWLTTFSCFNSICNHFVPKKQNCLSKESHKRLCLDAAVRKRNHIENFCNQ